MTTLAATLAPPKERAGVRAAYQIALVIGGALLVSGLAQISIRLPFTPVPITGQTLGVLLVGASLGPSLGAASMLLYVAMAWAGMPVVAPNTDGGHTVGLQVIGLTSATGGYIWGFVIAAWAVGELAKRGWDRTMRSSISAMLIGEVIIYAFGIPWLMQAIDVPLAKGLEYGFYPFVIGDVLKLFLAAALLPLAWKITGKGGGDV